MQRISDDEWLKLRLAMEQKSLVLVVGPGISTVETPEGPQLMTVALRDAFWSKLDATKRPPEPPDLSTTAGLLVTEKGRATLEVIVDDFFRQPRPVNEIQKAFAALPVSLIVNASPDKQICRALEKENIAYREEIYDFRRPRDFIYEPRDPRPFVYHLFGAVDCSDWASGERVKTLSSLVISGTDKLEFVKQVVQTERKIPKSLLAELNDTKTFLFVGFDFDNWYLRLLLYGLGLSDRVDSMPSWALHGGAKALDFASSTFYKSRYRINFMGLPLADLADDLRLRQIESFSKLKTAVSVSARSIRAVILATDADVAFREEMEMACAPLRRQYGLEFLQIEAGDDREAVLAEHVAASQFVFPLITVQFLADDALIDFFYEKVLAADEDGKRAVSPILCGICSWKPLLRGPILNNVMPSNLEPIRKWTDSAAAWTNVIEEIERRIKTHFLT